MLCSSLPYFGSLATWAAFVRAGEVCFRQNERFQRRSEHNRTEIASSQGRQLLSVPLAGGRNQRVEISVAQIDQRQKWQRQHWLSIVAAYGSAPFWTEFQDGLEALFLCTYQQLWDLNWACVSHVNDELNAGLVLRKCAAPTPPDRTESFAQAETSQELTPYPQVFSERTGWQANLSILDLMLCQGPAAVGYLSAVPV